ncbi:phosphatase PAP2 family protein [Paraliomyxa miuraensis]|uniref:phosphatase PAP2 family protein n=1 Tax=Paraliomyxa miuraensis TaxID=376150 RepID=UPI0022559BC4|nr:phosphatase PAP2 family protein [Paraliomyxa miuraensis]MCX4243344.1 phosphatase PAP2 family protein [Paraliomyxa miuraensis]
MILLGGACPAHARALDGEPPVSASEPPNATNEPSQTAAASDEASDATAAPDDGPEASAPGDDAAPSEPSEPSEEAPPSAGAETFVAVPAPPLQRSPTSSPPVSRPVHPLHVRWGITAPVIATTGLGFAIMERLGESRAAPTVCSPPREGTCPDLGILEPIDGVALGHYNGTAATLSDVTMALALVGPLVVSLTESIRWARREREQGVDRPRRRGAARFGIDTAIWAESIGVAMLTTDILKDAVGRPRPLAHLPEDTLLAEGVEPDGDFGRSFPSGHATITFASAVAGAMLLTLAQCEPQPHARRCAPRTRRQKVGLGLAWGLGLAAASATATLRVVAGKHYPTDVLMGAVLGASSGIAVPLLHDRRWR